MSFYRTYRPQIISEIDNTHVREQVLSLLKKDRSELPHAYLLTGPKGSGKTTTARIIAKLYTCTKFSKKSGPCGQCESCTTIARGTYMDVLELDAASNRGIDEIRELRNRIALTPVSGDYKIYIIDEVHMLTTEAFNALLKTLEEPPKHAVFILATTDSGKVPATIKSRCVSIPFRKANQEELLTALKKIVIKEHINVDPDAVAFIASVADGAFRDAVKLLEQVSFGTKNITLAAVTDLLATSDDGMRERFVQSVIVKDQTNALHLIEDMVSNGKDIKQFIVDILKDCQRMVLQPSSWDSTSCQQFMALLISAYGQMKISPITELPLELAVMEYCKKDTEVIEKKPEKKELPKEGATEDTGLLSLEKLVDSWKDVIEAVKPHNHSIAGVLRSAYPKAYENGVVLIATKYKFHEERLSEVKVRDILATVFKKLFGVQAKVEIVLEKL